MLPQLSPDTTDQSSALAQVNSRIQQQLATYCAQAREDQPDWFIDLSQHYPGRHVPADALEAVVIWRAVSDQEEEPTPLGKEPSVRDHTRQYWDRMQTTLHQPNSSAEPSSANEDPAQRAEPTAEEEIPEPVEKWSSVEAMLTDFEEIEASLDAELEITEQIDPAILNQPDEEPDVEEMFLHQRRQEASQQHPSPDITR